MTPPFEAWISQASCSNRVSLATPAVPQADKMTVQRLTRYPLLLRQVSLHSGSKDADSADHPLHRA